MTFSGLILSFFFLLFLTFFRLYLTFFGFFNVFTAIVDVFLSKRSELVPVWQVKNQNWRKSGHCKIRVKARLRSQKK